jgi:cell division protein FtsL
MHPEIHRLLSEIAKKDWEPELEKYRQELIELKIDPRANEKIEPTAVFLGTLLWGITLFPCLLVMAPVSAFLSTYISKNLSGFIILLMAGLLSAICVAYLFKKDFLLMLHKLEIWKNRKELAKDWIDYVLSPSDLINFSKNRIEKFLMGRNREVLGILNKLNDMIKDTKAQIDVLQDDESDLLRNQKFKQLDELNAMKGDMQRVQNLVDELSDELNNRVLALEEQSADSDNAMEQFHVQLSSSRDYVCKLIQSFEVVE